MKIRQALYCFLWYRKVYSRYHCENCTRLLPKAIFLFFLSILFSFAYADTLKLKNSEAKNVEASVLMDEKGDFGFGDGLLGMSFLKNFSFKIDQKEKKLTLEKL